MNRPSNKQTYSVMAQLIFCGVSLSQSKPILISCQSPTLIKSKLLFLFVASNLCEHTGLISKSAVAPLNVKITVEIFFQSWISYLIFIEAVFLLKSKPPGGHSHFKTGTSCRHAEKATDIKTFHVEYYFIMLIIITISILTVEDYVIFYY